MASIHIDDKVKALINNSYPQTQDAGDDAEVKIGNDPQPHSPALVLRESRHRLRQLAGSCAAAARASASSQTSVS